MRRKSRMIFGDCLAALRKQRSMVVLVLPLGDFASHATPSISMMKCGQVENLWLARKCGVKQGVKR